MLPETIVTIFSLKMTKFSSGQAFLEINNSCMAFFASQNDVVNGIVMGNLAHKSARPCFARKAASTN